MKDYSIENLVKAFGDHHKQSMDDYEKRKDKYPGSKEILHDFCLALALQEICREIIELKKNQS